MHAVEVGDDRVDVDRLGQVDQRRERSHDLQVLGVVDLDRVTRGHLLDGDVAEEAVTVLAQALRPHDVEGARLAELGRAVLPHLPAGAVVVDPLALGRPEEGVVGHAGQHRVGLALEHLAHSLRQVGGVDEGAGALHEHDDLGLDREGVEGVQQRALAGGGGARQLGRPLDDRGARLAGGLRDPRVVGADHDLVDQLGALGRLHGARDQRNAAHLGEVLQGNARRTSAGGNDGEDSQRGSLNCLRCHGS
ncbi:hypothetical protein GCM10020219_074250 [Nonomuraea dietziae]